MTRHLCSFKEYGSLDKEYGSLEMSGGGHSFAREREDVARLQVLGGARSGVRSSPLVPVDRGFGSRRQVLGESEIRGKANDDEYEGSADASRFMEAYVDSCGSQHK